MDRSNLKDLFKDNSGTTDLDSKVWLKGLRDRIFSMFKSPLKEDYRAEVFEWVSTICMCQPKFSWLCANQGTWTKDEAKVFSLIVRLSMNEIQILLPLVHRHLTSGDEVELEDGKVVARPASAGDYSNLGVHLIIFEEAIMSLVDGCPEDDEEARDNKLTLADIIEPIDLKSLLERLKEVILELTDYLEVVHKNWTVLIEELDGERSQAALGVLRLIAVWLIDDPGGLKSQTIHSVRTCEDELTEAFRDHPNYRLALQKYLDHVQLEYTRDKTRAATAQAAKRLEKEFKLRCGIVKDLLT